LEIEPGLRLRLTGALFFTLLSGIGQKLGVKLGAKRELIPILKVNNAVLGPDEPRQPTPNHRGSMVTLVDRTPRKSEHDENVVLLRVDRGDHSGNAAERRMERTG
jgi:hypothetical protein